jgi:hypothetical protein
MYLQLPMKSDVFTTPHEEWCIYNTPWRVMYQQQIHHSSWGVVNTSLFMGCCKYITLHGELLIHHSSWGVVSTPLFMGSCIFTTPHEEWCIYNTPWRVMYLQLPMKSGVFTTPHEEWCIYNSPCSWGVVNTSLFMGSCRYITLHGVL